MTVVALQEEVETCGERGWTGGLLVSYLLLLFFLISHVRVLLSSVLHFLRPSAGPFHNHPSVTCQATSMRVIALSGFLVRQLLSVSVCLVCLCLFVCVIIVSHQTCSSMQLCCQGSSSICFGLSVLFLSVLFLSVSVCLSVCLRWCLFVSLSLSSAIPQACAPACIRAYTCLCIIYMCVHVNDCV